MHIPLARSYYGKRDPIISGGYKIFQSILQYNGTQFIVAVIYDRLLAPDPKKKPATFDDPRHPS